MSSTPRTLLRLVAALGVAATAVGYAHAADFVVTSNADSGPGSLREAIDAANIDGGPSTITFDPGLAGQTIALASGLSNLSEPGTTLDGDLGGDCVPDIVLDGSASGASGLVPAGNGHTIRGFALVRFPFNGIEIRADGNTVTCNAIGTDAAGTPGVGNLGDGVYVQGNGNVIGPGNVIDNNAGSGVRVADGNNGAYPGFPALVPDFTGVFPTIDFDSDGNGEAFQTSGGAIVPLDGGGAPFTDNFGMRLTGELMVSAAGTYTFTLEPLDDVARLTVDGNVIFDGGGPGPVGGSLALADGAHTIRLEFFEGGGYAAIALAISGPGSATLNTNQQAVCATGQAGLCGELFQLRVASEGNTVTGNRIANNAGLGISLKCCGPPLANDAGDNDLGANTWLNHPVIAGLASAGNGQYTLTGTAPPNATIEVFEAVVDPSGFGEAGSQRLTFVSDGAGNFSSPIALPAQPGVLTATATDAAGNTSELGPNFPYGGPGDSVTVGAGAVATAGTATTVPIHVRDLSFTPLGADLAAGNRIQGLAFRIDFPPGTVTAASIAPSGITSGLTPLFGPNTSFSADSVNYVVSYAEAGNAIPFTLDGAAPGDVVAQLSLTLAPDAPPGSLALALNASTELSNQAGTVAENDANGRLVLVDGSLAVASNAARGLYAAAQGSGTVRLWWFDPELIETGFRIERSLDGVSYTPVQSVGDDGITFDDTGLTAGTLYYYRVVTETAAGDGNVSNRATAVTFPATATNICIDAQVVSRRWARSPDAAFRGPDWGLVYHDRDDGTREQVFFQRLDGNTLAAIGPRVQVTNTTTTAQFPAIAWNGTHYAVTWLESLRGAPGSLPVSGIRFAQLDGNGTVLRSPRRMDFPPPALGFFGTNEIVRPRWDGTHWGLFVPEFENPFEFTITYRRVEPDGDIVLGPVSIATSTDRFQFDVDSAFQPLSSEFGVVWAAQRDNSWEIRFQRVEEANGLTQLGTPALITTATLTSTTSMVADPAGGWLVAWVECDNTECATFTRRVAADGTPDPGGKVRVSTAPGPRDDSRVRLTTRPGGFAAFVENFESGGEEILRYHLDATGAPDGLGPTPVSVDDGRRSGRPRVASDGTRALVTWSESTSTLEIAGRLSDGATGALGTEAVFTAGHSPGNTSAVIVPGSPRIASLASGGFVSVWTEPASGTSVLHGRLYDGIGTLLSDFAPLSPTAVGGRPGLASDGSTFALAWRAPGNVLRFARFAANGTVLTPEATVLGSVGIGSVELGWDGEQFVAVYNQGASLRYVRIDAAGVAAPPVTLSLGLTSNVGSWRIAWMGDAWGLMYRNNGDGQLYFARFASDGTVVLAPTRITPVPPTLFVNPEFGLVYNGVELGITWNADLGADPPGSEQFFTLLQRDGNKVFPEVALIPGEIGDFPAQLHHANGRFHLVYLADNQGTAGMREIDIDLIPGGAVVAGGRYLANRGSAAAATAHDGAALALAWRMPASQDIHIETDACLADPTPPPCPSVSLVSAANNVRLSWPAVSDGESGMWRHHVFRDNRLLAELPGTQVSFDDSGYDTAVLHSYEVRAMNRAFQESPACPVQSFSTLVGDANGNGALEVADIFYLINFTLASGPPPLGDGDANGDGTVSVTDVFFLINYFFGGGPLPTAVDTKGSASS